MIEVQLGLLSAATLECHVSNTGHDTLPVSLYIDTWLTCCYARNGCGVLHRKQHLISTSRVQVFFKNIGQSTTVTGWGVTQDIKMGSCVFHCDIPHQWIAQRQVRPVSVYCDVVGCHVLCLRHVIPVWQHIGQSITATSRHHHDMTSDV